MLLSHRARPYARVLMIAGGLIVGFTVVSAFPATRVYLSEQFPTALRGRGHLFGESCGKIFAGDLVPFFMAPHTGSPTIFFGTMLFFAQSAPSFRSYGQGDDRPDRGDPASPRWNSPKERTLHRDGKMRAQIAERLRSLGAVETSRPSLRGAWPVPMAAFG
jgi:hypothetical protein